ncbi:alpha/beta fold hydrolase [Legionella drozanskii]|uniref:Lipolytic protein n=1 Tax=Legionella drozanskii LLAP-1 TaxID=1212489 RepID=A0A0W0SVP1_9GAMM|nr:alpha/beta hydrolase [Legionella drozanskii]KTC87245.1 lipolytic protein [Legionella drozanskii LLAP-1]
MKILFIPGLLCTSEVWGGLNLLRNDFDCFDADVSRNNSIFGMSEDTISMIAQEAENSIVAIGISMGGYVALNLALQHIRQIKMLVLINTSSHAVAPETVSNRLEMIEYVKEGRFSEVLKSSKGYCFFKTSKETDELEIRMGISVGADAYINQQTAIISREDLTNRLQEINIQTLIISGKNDQILPVEDSYEMFDLITDSKLVAYSNCGHLSTLEGKNIYNDVSGFIKNDFPSNR